MKRLKLTPQQNIIEFFRKLNIRIKHPDLFSEAFPSYYEDPDRWSIYGAEPWTDDDIYLGPRKQFK